MVHANTQQTNQAKERERVLRGNVVIHLKKKLEKDIFLSGDICGIANAVVKVGTYFFLAYFSILYSNFITTNENLACTGKWQGILYYIGTGSGCKFEIIIISM